MRLAADGEPETQTRARTLVNEHAQLSLGTWQCLLLRDMREDVLWPPRPSELCSDVRTPTPSPSPAPRRPFEQFCAFEPRVALQREGGASYVSQLGESWRGLLALFQRALKGQIRERVTY